MRLAYTNIRSQSHRLPEAALGLRIPVVASSDAALAYPAGLKLSS